MTRAAIIRLLEADFVKPDLAPDVRLKLAAEIAILRGWQASQGHFIDSNKPKKRGTKKLSTWCKWLQTRCPAEYRPQHPSVTMPYGLEEFIVSYIKKVCRARWSLSNLDAALRYALEQRQKVQAEGETKS